MTTITTEQASHLQNARDGLRDTLAPGLKRQMAAILEVKGRGRDSRGTDRG